MSANNARLIEKDILADIGSANTGNSEIVDLFGEAGGAWKLSCQAVYDVQAPSAKTFDSGESEVTTFTFPAVAASTGGDYGVVFDTAGLAWAFALNKSGSDPAPTGAVWAAIPAGRKTNVNISGGTDAASVAALVETAFDALAANPFTTDDSAADGTMIFTCVIRGNTTVAQKHNANDSGNGSLTFVVTNDGVASEVNITTNSLSIPSHGFPEGLKVRLTTTGTLPAGLALATDYFVIVVDANTIQLASSLALALAGTAVDITDQGSDGAVNTATGVALSGATVTFQCSNDGTNWSDIQAATSITIDGATMLVQPNVSYRYFKVVKALTAGVVDLKALVLVVGDAV